MNLNKKHELGQGIDYDPVLNRKKDFKMMVLSNNRFKKHVIDYQQRKTEIRKEYLEMSKKIRMQVIDVKKFNKLVISKKKGKKGGRGRLEMKLPQIKKNLNKTEEFDVDRTLKCTKNRKQVIDSSDSYSSDISYS